MSNSQPRKLTKLERERIMYEKLGMQHPKDKALDVALANLRGFMRKLHGEKPDTQDRLR